MITKLYWAFRIFGYIACLGGVFLFLAHQTDSSTKSLSLGLVGLGFLGFFVSYAIRAWLRFGPGRKTG